MIKINEIFSSFQSEGRQFGLPAIFVRLANCNLNCKFCDTNYDTNYEYSASKLFEKIIEEQKNIKMKNPLIIFTGGEPLLQFTTIIPVIESLLIEGYNISVETNGSIGIPFLAGTEQIYYTISPKKYYKYENFKQAVDFKTKFENSSFKFVINDIEELEFIYDYLKEFKLLDELIYLQPEFSKSEILVSKILKNKYSEKLNYKFSFQTNKYINIK